MFPLIFQHEGKNRNSKTTKQLKTTMQLTINLINSAWIRLSENRKSEFWPISVSPRRQNHFPINHALLSMEKSSFGRNFTCVAKSRIEKSILKLNGPLFRNWMKIVSFSAFTVTRCFQLSNLRFPIVKITFQSTTLYFRWKRAVLDAISPAPAKAE